jgi:hypothetical protein
MYGPPQNCKRKLRMTDLVCANVFGLGGVSDPGPWWDPPALFPVSEIGLKGPLPISGLESAGSTVVPSQYFRQQTWREFIRSSIAAERRATSSLRWINSRCSQPEVDTSRSCIRPPKPCGAAYSPAPQLPRSGACAPSVVLTSNSAQEPAWCDIASQLMRLARTAAADSRCPVC